MTRRSVIVDRLGPDNAAKLSRVAGGQRFHVPERLRDADRLTRLLGPDLAILVVLHFGASRIYVPVPTRDPKRNRIGKFVAVLSPRTVARLTENGWSASRIARKYRCSERTVHAARARAIPRLQPIRKAPTEVER